MAHLRIQSSSQFDDRSESDEQLELIRLQKNASVQTNKNIVHHTKVAADKIVVFSRDKKRPSIPCRPSLSEQLASIGAKAAALTMEMKQTHGLVDNSNDGKPIHCFPANNFTVGSLRCRYPSPVSFYPVS